MNKNNLNLSDKTEDIQKILFKSPEDVFRLPSIKMAKSQYRAASPYPHLIIDDFLSPEVIELVKNALLEDSHTFGVNFSDDVQNKKTISTGDDVPQILQILAGKYASPFMIRYFEELLGIKSLIPDPYYNTDYGYYHISEPGGHLGAHVDHSHHQSMGIPHVLNIVVYLTPDWRDDYGGALHLFNQNGRKSIKRIPCLYNRAVVFACNPSAFHGVEPIKKNLNIARHSLYFAYYKVAPEQANNMDVNPSLKATSEDHQLRHGTFFKMTWAQLIKKQNRAILKGRLMELIVVLTPPIAILIYRKMKKYKK